MKTIDPGPALRDFVRCFEIVETTEPMTRTLLPVTGFAVGFRYAGAAALVEDGKERRVPTESMTGVRTTARRMHTSANSGMILAKLHVARAGRFVGGSLHAHFGEVRALGDVVCPSAVAVAAAGIVSARTDGERAAILEQFLLSIARPWQPDEAAERGLTSIDASRGAVRMRALAKLAGASQDAFEKRFRRSVGASPKQYAGLVRLRHAVDACVPGRKLGAVSVDAGYGDQSHFIRHFRQVTGESPGRLLASAEYC